MRIPYQLSLLALLAACTAPVDNTDAGPADPDAPLACEDSIDCAERSICQGGVCQSVGAEGCTTKSECAAGQVCLSGTCSAPAEACASSEECPGAFVCDGFSQRCVDLNASGCQVASDCALENGCQNGCTCETNGTCAPVAAGVDAGPQPGAGSVDLSNFRIENREHDPPIQIGVLPSGTTLSSGQHLVLARNATKGAFESFWGVSLGNSVVYLNAGLEGGGVPNVNGDETWALLSPVGTLIDETAIGPDKNSCYHRQEIGDGTDPDNWAVDDMDNALPGGTDMPASGVGLVIDQWSDASDFPYEFLQIYYAP